MGTPKEEPKAGELWRYARLPGQGSLWRILGVDSSSRTVSMEHVGDKRVAHSCYSLKHFKVTLWRREKIAGICAECGESALDDYLCEDCRRVTIDEAIQHSRSDT